MISVKEAAAALGISPRSVQEKCNKFKVVKVNGQFQITQELLDLWLTKAERKTNEAAAQPKPRTELAKTSQKTALCLVANSFNMRSSSCTCSRPNCMEI
jgi:truncated hemoglobin YjbI